MPDISQTFSIKECEDWNKRYENANKKNDKKEIIALLSEANKVFFDEYFIYTTILKINNEDLSQDEKNKLIESINKSRIVKFTDVQSDFITIHTKANTIKVAKLSDIIPDVLKDTNLKSSVERKDTFSAEYLSQLITFQNHIVTGYVHGICDKSKKIHTWVEFTNNYGQEFVVDYDDNTVYNKEGFYFLKHADIIKKVASDELRGKSSKSISGSASEITNQIIDIEIDMGDER